MMLKTCIAGSTPTISGAFSGEVDAGSPQKMRPMQGIWSAFRFLPIGMRSSAGILGVLALVFASVFAPSVAVAQAGGVPSLEFAQGCRNTASGDATILGRCMRDEQRAQQKLTAEWETFPHADRTQCTALAKLGNVIQSYVELITCLEMAKDASALPKSAKE